MSNGYRPVWNNAANPMKPDNPPPATISSSNNYSYVINSRIMVVAVAVLFTVVLFIVCLHIYAKWFWRTRAAGRPRAFSWWRRHRHRFGDRTSDGDVLYVDLQAGLGLDKSVVDALPTFEYKAELAAKQQQAGGLECAVCLEVFEEGEKGRTLPKCGHSFHLDCIDMWLHSHSTCPLCRASLRPADEEEKPLQFSEQSPVLDEQQQQQERAESVAGDVQIPFLASIRASRSLRGLVLNSSLGTAETGEERSGNATEPQHPTSQPEQTLQMSQVDETSPTAASREPKTIAKSSEIPSNVLFWGHHTQMSATPQSNAGSRALRAPFHIAIDIPRSSITVSITSTDASASSPSIANLRSPMARASASFRRLLSRGHGHVASPQTQAPDVQDEEEDGPSFLSSPDA